jgi:hypothetical protein
MLIFYALEDRSPWFVLRLLPRPARWLDLRLLQGAWPFGLVEAVAWAASPSIVGGQNVEGLEHDPEK